MPDLWHRLHSARPPDHRDLKSDQQVVAVGGVDTPLLVRRQELSAFSGLPLDFCPITSFTERCRSADDKPAGFHRNHASTGVLIQLLTTRERTPWDQLVNVV